MHPGRIRRPRSRAMTWGSSLHHSPTSTFHFTTSYPSLRALIETARLSAPYGGRRRRTPNGVKACSQARICWRRASDEILGSARWSQLWFPTACPMLATRRTRSGWAAAASPIMKNVARAWWRSRTSSTRGVQWGFGPSSNVSAAAGSAVTTLVTGPRSRPTTYRTRASSQALFARSILSTLSLRLARVQGSDHVRQGAVAGFGQVIVGRLEVRAAKMVPERHELHAHLRAARVKLAIGPVRIEGVGLARLRTQPRQPALLHDEWRRHGHHDQAR